MSKLFQWNRMFPPVQLPVDNHAVSFTDASVVVFYFELCPVSVGTWSPFLLFSVDHSFSPSGTCNVT